MLHPNTADDPTYLSLCDVHTRTETLLLSIIATSAEASLYISTSLTKRLQMSASKVPDSASTGPNPTFGRESRDKTPIILS